MSPPPPPPRWLLRMGAGAYVQGCTPCAGSTYAPSQGLSVCMFCTDGVAENLDGLPGNEVCSTGAAGHRRQLYRRNTLSATTTADQLPHDDYNNPGGKLGYASADSVQSAIVHAQNMLGQVRLNRAPSNIMDNRRVLLQTPLPVSPIYISCCSKWAMRRENDRLS